MEDSSSKVNSADETSSEKILKNLPPEPFHLVSSNEEKSSLMSPSSPIMVDNNMEDEDEHIEVDELPDVEKEALRREVATGSTSEENTVSDIITISKLDPKSPQEIGDLSTNNNKKYDSKYCKSCDISFKYLPTYVAHKKYYCSSQRNEEATSPLSGSESMVVPTNMATAAHTV